MATISASSRNAHLNQSALQSPFGVLLALTRVLRLFDYVATRHVTRVFTTNSSERGDAKRLGLWMIGPVSVQGCQYDQLRKTSVIGIKEFLKGFVLKLGRVHYAHINMFTL